MEDSKLPLRSWAWAIYLEMTSLNGVSSMKLHRDLGVTQKTAWFMLHMIQEAFADVAPIFDGPVKVDETYVVGKRANMSNAQRTALKDTGRGAVGMTAVVGMKDRATNQVSARVIKRTDKTSWTTTRPQTPRSTPMTPRPTRDPAGHTRRSGTRRPSTFGT